MSLSRPISMSPHPVPISRAATDRALKSHVKETSAPERAQLPFAPVAAGPVTQVMSPAAAQPSAGVAGIRATQNAAPLQSAPQTPAPQPTTTHSAAPPANDNASVQPHTLYTQKAGKVIDTSAEDRMRQVDILA